MIDLFAAKRMCLPMRGVLRFGGSSSKSTTENISQETGASDQAQAVGITGSSNTVNLTDQGAFKGALDLALKGVEGAYNIAGQAQASNGSLLTGALQSATEQQKQFATALENVKTADVRVLIIAGLAVVGLGAVYMAKKG